MVRARTSTARSRLHESISAFVPLFLSNRSASAVPHAPRDSDIEEKFEYIGSVKPSALYEGTSQAHHQEPSPRPPQSKRRMHPSPISRTQTSSSHGSSSTTSKNSRPKRPQHMKTRTRPSQSRSTSSTTPHPKQRTTRTRPRRKITAFTRLRLAVESKFRLTLAFGLGFISSLVIYLGLFLSHISSGATFHVLSILLLIALLAIFTHSLLRFLALNTELKAVRAHRAGLKKTPSARGWNISRPLPQFASSSESDGIYDGEKANSTNPAIGTANGGYENDEFPVFDDMAARNYGTDYDYNPYDRDQDHDIEANAGAHSHHHTHPPPVAYPPPVYGNTRSSVRLSITPPESQHPTSDPNITAPTPVFAPGMSGWHPPSFRSEGGITAVLERRRMEVQDRLGVKKGGAEVLGQVRYEPKVMKGGMI